MFKRIGILLGVLATLVAGAFGFAKVAAVTLDDVASHFDLGRAQATVGVAGGDIYAISPDGLSETRLCSLELQDEFVDRIKVNARFSNVIGTTLPFLTDWLSPGVADSMMSAAEFAGARLRFEGEFTELQAEAPRDIAPDCERRMAEYANSRHRICMVRSSLVPTDNSAFSAYRFDRMQIFLPDRLFALYGMEKSEAAQTIQFEACPASSALPWDVAVRKSLRLIEMELVRSTPIPIGGAAETTKQRF